MDVLISRPIRISRDDRATITGTIAQVEKWRAKRKQLGLTDAELLRHVLPILDQFQSCPELGAAE